MIVGEGPPDKDKKSFKKMLSNLHRRGKRRGHSEPSPKEAAQPPPQSPPPEKLKPFSSEKFSKTAAQLKAEKDPRGQIEKLTDEARKRPKLAGAFMALFLFIFVGDLILLMRSMGVTEWLQISFILGPKKRDLPAGAEERLSALSFFTKDEEERTVEPSPPDEIKSSAIDGKSKLPANKWKIGSLKGTGVTGIGTKGDRSGPKLTAIPGLDSNVSGSEMRSEHMMIAKSTADAFSPYSPTARGSKEKVMAGVYFGEEGEFLENFASVERPVKAPDDFNFQQPVSRYKEVPQGAHGEEMVNSMLDDNLMSRIQDYAKNGTYKLRRTRKGEGTHRHELEGMMLEGNEAVFQLLGTKRASDIGLNCSTCETEKRIHNAGATFYGEPH